VVTCTQVDARGLREASASAQIVRIDWILDSVRLQARADEAKYTLPALPDA